MSLTRQIESRPFDRFRGGQNRETGNGRELNSCTEGRESDSGRNQAHHDAMCCVCVFFPLLSFCLTLVCEYLFCFVGFPMAWDGDDDGKGTRYTGVVFLVFYAPCFVGESHFWQPDG